MAVGLDHGRCRRDALLGRDRDLTERDSLAAGIDPDRAVIYLQSAVPEVYELNPILEMLVGFSRLSRLKEMTFGLLGYPVLQAAGTMGEVRSAMVPEVLWKDIEGS